MYQEYPPTAVLSPLIECYWSLTQDAASTPSPTIETVYPDGRIELVFNRAAPAREVGGDRQPRAFVFGQLRRGLRLLMPSETEVFAIRFQPWGAFPILGLPLGRLIDSAVDVDEFPRLGPLRDAVDGAVSIPEAVRAADQALLAHVASAQPTMPGVGPLVRWIHRPGVGDRVDDICRQAGWSARSCERHFGRFVGVSPKTFLRILRFQRTLKALQAPTRESLAGLAAAQGYTDQAHLYKDFRAFTGAGPRRFLAGGAELFDDLYRPERLERILS